jgi:beta-lactamase class A
MLKKSVPSYFVILFSVFCCLITAFLMGMGLPHQSGNKNALQETPSTQKPATPEQCSTNAVRLGGSALVKPLLTAEPECESERFLPMKSAIEAEINALKNSGTITSAAVYVKDMGSAEWMAVNGDEKFSPGSIVKVPALITCLKMAEKDLQFLNKSLRQTHGASDVLHVSFPSKTIEIGRAYTVRELLPYMITYSDNNAYQLIFNNIDISMYKKVYTDLEMAPFDVQSLLNFYNVREISELMKVIYNASYLSAASSEFAMELLTQCEFKQGIAAGLPTGTKIAHKFGESGSEVSGELHETAIIYTGTTVYELTILTKGTVMLNLPQALSSISQVTYNNMMALHPNS